MRETRLSGSEGGEATPIVNHYRNVWRWHVETSCQGVCTIGDGQSHVYIQNVVSCQTLRFRLQA